ncbi:DUF6907 domain-containing protein [Streptomyces sp. NPDC058217]|uniref:DUF6907 domain-containing protein n=1 Tax=Streptomyces sp. NPDC058217 TaxID=3346384 RepID=UPI0036E308EE
MTTLLPEPAPVPAQAAPSLASTPPAAGPSSARRSWLRKLRGGGQIVESCPDWCTDNHRGDASGALIDLSHGSNFPGTPMAVFDAALGTVAMPLLASRINVDPYSDQPERRVPHVVLEPFQDEVMECLSPDEFAAVIAQVRERCDFLMGKVHAQLVKARAEYH